MIYLFQSASNAFLNNFGVRIIMSSTLKSLRALSDPTRLRTWRRRSWTNCLWNELQEITRLGQSRISTHLGLLADCACAIAADGKRTFYKLNPQATRRHRRIHPTRHSRREGTPPNTAATRSISSAFSPAAKNRRRFSSIKSPGVLIASMGRAARGRRSGICCCGYCRRSLSRTSARAKAC